MLFIAYLVVVTLLILIIVYMIWDNYLWQKKMLKLYSRAPSKKKVKLKKGQTVVFAEKEEFNPFEEIASANTNS